MVFAYIKNTCIKDAPPTIIPLVVEYVATASGYGYEVGANHHA